MLDNKKRIVIKIGSSLLVKDGEVKKNWLKTLASGVATLRQSGKEVIIVTSGSIAVGRNILNKKGDLSLEEKQAVSSVGQIELISNYNEIFSGEDLKVAQILLTGSDSSNRDRYLNAKNTFLTLIKNDVIAIVNENDTVATEEIRIGDNDRLAARVAQMVDADLLILLSDVDGLYDSNPNINKDAQFVELIEEIDEKIEKMASHATSGVGTGGMITKIKAAKMAFNSGCDTIITNGIRNNPILQLLNGARHSLFKSNKKKINSKKQWIVDDFNFKGELIINDCAVTALKKNTTSLLPIGVVEVKGKFEEGDVVLVKDENDKHIATGIASYSFSNAKIIIGKNTSQIKEIFGQNIKEELIHKDNLVLI